MIVVSYGMLDGAPAVVARFLIPPVCSRHGVPIHRATDDNIYRHLEAEPTAIRSIVINTGNFPPSFHSPAMGSGRHHLVVMSPPAAGRIIERVNLLDQAQRKTTRLMSINCANEHKLCQFLVEGRHQLYRDRDIL